MRRTYIAVAAAQCSQRSENNVIKVLRRFGAAHKSQSRP